MKTASIALLGLVCLTSAIASADSITITGEADIGFARSLGDFIIQGPGLSLAQGTPDGPSTIGSCTVGSVCDFSFGIPSVHDFGFCYCKGFSGGSVGSQTADFLVPSLTLTGSALYSGGDSLTVPMTISGTIIGYKLVDCFPGGIDCKLGPPVFTLKVMGQGEDAVVFNEIGSIIGSDVTFTGRATVVPEPSSLVLISTGLAAVVWRKYKRQGTV